MVPRWIIHAEKDFKKSLQLHVFITWSITVFMFFFIMFNSVEKYELQHEEVIFFFMLVPILQ